MIIIDLFDIDFHIFTVIKFLFNLVVRFKYIKSITHFYKTASGLPTPVASPPVMLLVLPAVAPSFLPILGL